MRRPQLRLSGPVLDAADPIGLARFYERLLGWEIFRSEEPEEGSPRSDGWAVIRSPDGRQKIEFQGEPHYLAPTWPPVNGQQLMMMHLDFGADDLEAAVQWAVEAGARLSHHQPQDDVRVMLDPEGHPFCVFADQQ